MAGTRKLWVVLAFAALAAGAVAVSQAQEKSEPGTVTVQGEILDMACYVAKGAKGPDHAKCAQACVKGGQPMGLLAKDGTVYVLYAHHDNASAFEAAKDHAGKQVEIVGVASKQSGVNGLEVHSVKAP